MKKGPVIGVTMFTMMCLFACNLFAAPQNGFGLCGGLASHSMDGTVTAGFLTGAKLDYSSTGLTIGIDYQIALSPEFSLNPFLMSSSENTSGDTASGVMAGHGILGIQGRYWFENNIFIGAHLGMYTEYLSNSGTSSNGNGAGFGLVVGWEKLDGGLFLMGQLDSAKVQYSDVDADINGLRFSVGYRWK